MAVAYDSTTFAHSPGYNNTHTLSHTASGSDRLAVAIVFCRHMSEVTGVTYNGVSMTQQTESVGGSTTRGARIYTLVNPPTGASNVVLSLSGFRRFSFGCITFTGVDQSSPIDATGAATPGFGETATTSITTIANNSMIVDAMQTQNDRTLTVGSGQTERINDSHSASDQGTAGASHKILATAGATTMTWTWTSGENWAACAVSLKEAGSAGSQEITVPHLASSSALYALTLTPQTVTLTTPFIAPTDITYAPTIAVATLNYSYSDEATLPTNANNLANSFTSTDYSDVLTDDNTYFDSTGDIIPIKLFKYNHDNTTDQITITWRGKSSLAPTSAGIILEVFNYDTASWELLDSDTATAVDTELELTGVVNSNISNYYDGVHNTVAARVYQENV